MRARAPLLLATLLLTGGARAAEVRDGPRYVAPIEPQTPAPTTPRDADAIEPNWTIPILHASGQLAAQRVGAMILWPEAFSLSDTGRDWRFLKDAYTNPPKFDPHARWFEWDGDRWQINVIGHGLMGSELYLRARTCGHDVLASLGFAAAASATWEYAIEVWNARPSLNDLIWTPLAGMALGELRFVIWKGARTFAPAPRVLVRAVVDPFGSLERWIGTRC
jgi:hypothetical protein